MKSVAVDTNVSVSTVSRLLDTINYSSPSVPECISIDEFKGNTDAGKFQCILVDAKKHRILDIYLTELRSIYPPISVHGTAPKDIE